MDRRLPALAAVAAATALFAAVAPPPVDGTGDPNPPATGTDPAKDGKGAGKPKGKPKGPTGERANYVPLSKEDREALKVNEGYLVPKPTADLVWLGGDAMTREDFAGKVTVIQSVSGKPAPRTALERLRKSLPEGVELIGLHTPDGADRAAAAFDKNPPCRVAVDASGKWCDALGVWTTPVNIVVGKTGIVAEVGLSEAGLQAKLPILLDEPDSGGIEGQEREAAPGTPAAPAGDAPAPASWPAPATGVKSATDRQGQKMPAFAVEKWLSPQADPGTRLIAMDFWATWCPPCRAAIPHLNELQGKFGDDVLFVGISDENEKAFNDGLKKYKLSPSGFKYSVALDTKKTLKQFFGISGIPHMAIASADGTVRWQGHPMELKDEDLTKLIAANKAANPGTSRGSAPGTKSRGWANRPPQKSR